MPYSGPDDPELPKHVAAMPMAKKKKWVGIFNGVMESCKKGEKECESMAFATANDRVKDSEKSVSVELDAENRTLTLEDGTTYKYYDSEYVYIPSGVTSISDAIAAMDAKEEIRELKRLVDIYTQVCNNIMYSTDVSDKKSAIAKLADEFSEALVDYTEGDVDKSFKALAQTRGGRKFPRSSFLVAVGDKPSEWHLPVKNPDGTPNHRLMGAAWAALHSGFRGKKYSGPNKEQAIAKLKRLYRSEGMDLPTEKSFDAEEFFAIKSIGEDRVGSYAALWGDEETKDFTGEFFDETTEEMDVIFKAIGALPLLYHHGMDKNLKTTVIGKIDMLEPDDLGLWYEAQVKMADEYSEQVKKLIQSGKLKSSSQTLVSRRKVAKNGHIERWPIVEISATPTPAEPRMVPLVELKSMYQTIGCTDFVCAVKEIDPDAEFGEGSQGAEEARLRGQIEAERLALLELEL